MKKILLALKALQAGESLANSSAWKNRQLATNALFVVIGTIPQIFDVNLSDSDVGLISYGIATVGSLFNFYFTAATSEKVGLFGV